jgi:hypothetical protein
MKAKGEQVCWECNKARERCKAATVNENGKVEWVCPQCWKALDYDKYLYEHRLGTTDQEC